MLKLAVVNCHTFTSRPQTTKKKKEKKKILGTIPVRVSAHLSVAKRNLSRSSRNRAQTLFEPYAECTRRRNRLKVTEEGSVDFWRGIPSNSNNNNNTEAFGPSSRFQTVAKSYLYVLFVRPAERLRFSKQTKPSQASNETKFLCLFVGILSFFFPFLF